jgi:hypothetical protein
VKIKITSGPTFKLATVDSAQNNVFRDKCSNTICRDVQQPTNFPDVRYALLSDVLSKFEEDDFTVVTVFSDKPFSFCPGMVADIISDLVEYALIGGTATESLSTTVFLLYPDKM